MLARHLVESSSFRRLLVPSTSSFSPSSFFIRKHQHAASIRFQGSLPAASSLQDYRLSEHEKALQAQGLLDERGLTKFDTLHEMQVRSCRVYSEENLFGTYSHETQKFEWMTYADFDHQVNLCRAALKDLGMLCVRVFVNRD